MAEILRLCTIGSVDDGKSTLIGRLLYDTKTLFADQLVALERASRAKGEEELNLALVTDGLRAEREQGITIDVAYRYFGTTRRRFILADAPGHVHYTRNMATAASTADVALVLLDARHGVLEQSRRHALVASLLGVPHFVVCVNKMDLVGWSQERFEQICEEFRRFAVRLDVHDVVFIPISALHGDNVVYRSTNMPWWEGISLLYHLEHVHIASDRNLIDARFPVQYVIRPSASNDPDLMDYRGYAGSIASGVWRPGDEVVVLPSGHHSRILEIRGPGGVLVDEAFPPQAVTMRLTDDLDVGRGDILCRPHNRPDIAQDLDAMLFWFSEQTSCRVGQRYVLRHTTRTVKAQIQAIDYRLDVDTLHRDRGAGMLSLNDIGRVRLHTQAPVMFDPYRRNRSTGSFILVDSSTNSTVAAGVVLGPDEQLARVVWHPSSVTRRQRPSAGVTVWFTGLPGSGKSTVAAEVERQLVAAGRPAYLLDGDNLRHGLNADLGFDPADRDENVRRVTEVAALFADTGVVALVSLVSPYRAARARARARHEAQGLRFLEVFVDIPLEICEARDPKGMYAKARAGELASFTGVSAPYERPESPDLVLGPRNGDPTAMAARVIELIGW